MVFVEFLVETRKSRSAADPSAAEPGENASEDSAVGGSSPKIGTALFFFYFFKESKPLMDSEEEEAFNRVLKF